jgi:hypothetical protein
MTKKNNLNKMSVNTQKSMKANSNKVRKFNNIYCMTSKDLMVYLNSCGIRNAQELAQYVDWSDYSFLFTKESLLKSLETTKELLHKSKDLDSHILMRHNIHISEMLLLILDELNVGNELLVIDSNFYQDELDYFEDKYNRVWADSKTTRELNVLRYKQSLEGLTNE